MPRTAPAAALEAVKNALPSADTVNSTTSSATSSLPSMQQVQDQASKTAASANATAQSVAAQATSLAQQAISQLPASVTSVLPASLTSPTAPATHQSAAPVTTESRETTSAPIAESRNDRPEGVLKPLVPDTSSGANAADAPLGQTGGDAFTQPHTTGNFAASGASPTYVFDYVTNLPHLILRHAASDAQSRHRRCAKRPGYQV